MVERPGRTPLGVAAFDWGGWVMDTERPPRWGGRSVCEGS